MPQCKYCRKHYENVEWIDMGLRTSQIPACTCPNCYYGVEDLKQMGRSAMDIGKAILKSFNNFREQRKRNLAAPSCKPRIRTTNDDGFSDLLELTETQWHLLSAKQLKSAQNRIDIEDPRMPKILALRLMGEVARRTRDTEEMNALARLYAKGLKGEVEPDEAESFKWYLESAELHDAEGQFHVARCYQHGLGVHRNLSRAFSYYQLAAVKGHAVACNNLAFCYVEGKGVKQDKEQAWHWYLKSASLGCAAAQQVVGQHYLDGDGVSKDIDKALEYLTQSAEQGDADAQMSLGELYFDGVDVPADMAKAFDWWKRAALRADKTAMNNVGCMYYKGLGTEKNADEARAWLKRAADAGEEKAKEHLREYFGEGN